MLSAGVLLPACSGNPGPRGADGGCALLPTDSAFLARGPVYRDCHVDRAARLDPRSVTPEFRSIPRAAPAGVGRCFVAEVEMVVGLDGRPEDGSWRIVRTNEPAFGEAILQSVRAWRFQPAELEGQPVRQIARETQRAMITIGAPGSATRPSTPRC